MTLLIGGFSSFPGAPANPTEALSRALEGVTTTYGEVICGRVLPVEWEGSWPALQAAIEAVQPRAVVLFGLHIRAERLRIELLARNRRELGRADAVGGFPSGPAVLDGPETLASRLPASRIATALRAAGIDFEWSSNAGAYLCNDTLYRLAHHAQRYGLEAYGFVHVPLSDELIETYAQVDGLPDVLCSLPEADLRRAALAIADALDPLQA